MMAEKQASRVLLYSPSPLDTRSKAFFKNHSTLNSLLCLIVI